MRLTHSTVRLELQQWFAISTLYLPMAARNFTQSRVYLVGTVMTDRLGYDRNVVAERKTRQRHIPRGSFTFSRSVTVPVYWFRDGCVDDTSQCEGTGPTMVPCPKAVNDYQAWMGGEDVHDQLRLQTFSIQTSVRFGKYCKSPFLGLTDLVMVYAYISHKEACQLSNTPAMKRGEWYNVLHKQLLQLKEHDFAGVSSISSPGSRNRRRKRIGHPLTQFDDWVTVSGRKKSFQTTFFCDKCSIYDSKCYLCPKARREYRGETSFQLWHKISIVASPFCPRWASVLFSGALERRQVCG
ncbi:hypothetical protein PHMEG_00021136 [Phytophthora megakarya]|uniref:PiggyBac transposable element-derived protein domain-containing protein n=1 Tax=Phytophthora megakarya TaxID=4795 RepID=A0A225VMK7_9STRA|nr:hypothetical protein PHMEG_00021136 [Phytophthora megakarya]